MHLRNVEIFCDTVSHRSFSKAAELRGISQPTVSQAIHQLEEKLGVALFDRSQRPLELTTGRSSLPRWFVASCWRVIRELEDQLQHLNGRGCGASPRGVDLFGRLAADGGLHAGIRTAVFQTWNCD